MKSYIFAAAAVFCAVANGSVVRRTDPDCEESGNGGSKPFVKTDTSSGADSAKLPCGATSSTGYTVVKGDTLGAISHRTGAGICDIASLNGIPNPDVINAGVRIQIPVGCTHPDNTTCLPDPERPATETCVPGLGSSYTVKSGDTLTVIAKDFNITLASVIAANKANIPNPDAIDVGQLVNIPVCPSSQCHKVGTYKIAQGDLFKILAKKYHTTIGQIKSLNVAADPNKLAIGQQIILPQGCKNVTSPAS